MPRDLPVPGRELGGVHQAMEYLPLANRVAAGRCDGRPDQITGRRASTSSSSAAATPAPTASAPRTGRAPRRCTQLEIMPRPPADRPGHQPWPTYPMIFRRRLRARGGRRAGLRGRPPRSSLGDGRPGARRCGWPRSSSSTARSEPVEGTEREIPARPGAARDGLHRAGAARGLVDAARRRARRARQRRRGTTRSRPSVPGVFVAGDMGRGQSLIVWAIAEGRAAARGVDAWLTGHRPAPPDRPDGPPRLGLIRLCGVIPAARPPARPQGRAPPRQSGPPPRLWTQPSPKSYS